MRNLNQAACPVSSHSGLAKVRGTHFRSAGIFSCSYNSHSTISKQIASNFFQKYNSNNYKAYLVVQSLVNWTKNIESSARNTAQRIWTRRLLLLITEILIQFTHLTQNAAERDGKFDMLDEMFSWTFHQTLGMTKQKRHIYSKKIEQSN